MYNKYVVLAHVTNTRLTSYEVEHHMPPAMQFARPIVFYTLYNESSDHGLGCCGKVKLLIIALNTKSQVLYLSPRGPVTVSR